MAYGRKAHEEVSGYIKFRNMKEKSFYMPALILLKKHQFMLVRKNVATDCK